MLVLPPGGVGALPCNYSLVQVLGAGAAAAARAGKQALQAEEKMAATQKEKAALEKEMAALLAASERQQMQAERKAATEMEQQVRRMQEQAKEVVDKEAAVAAAAEKARHAAEKKVASAMAAAANAEEEKDRLAAQMAGLLATTEQQLQHKAQQRRAVPVQWQVPSADITDVKVVGEGTFSTVWEVEYRGSRVAFKRIRGNSAKVAELGREARGLMKAQHPNVVTLLGVTMDDPHRSGLLMELAEHGTLRDVIDSVAVSAAATGGGRAGSGLPAAQQLRLASNIAAGIAWLHGNKPTPIVRVLHRT
jgi:hypothetical protein